MIPEIGYAATVVACALAIYGSVTAAMSGRSGRPTLLLSSERAAIGAGQLERVVVEHRMVRTESFRLRTGVR